MKDTRKQQRLAAKQRAIGVYQFYLARGFSANEAQQMQVDHFSGRLVATHSELPAAEPILAADASSGNVAAEDAD